ncbi:MAG TPA: DUF3592 domain-containing protein [Oscillospiraceae bacterium]|nr:DUF3592 domain-containing protein [Oscillospiraceae bacterium]
MNDAVIFALIGLTVMVLGILLFKREKRLFKDSVETTAAVTAYHEYQDKTAVDEAARRLSMYTMAVRYRLPDGTWIEASEQKGSNVKKYPEGRKIRIRYSRENPALFVVKGDRSRNAVMIGMIIVGALMTVIGGCMFFSSM